MRFANIKGLAIIKDYAKVFYASVSEQASIYENAYINSPFAKIAGSSQIYGAAVVRGNANVYGTSQVFDNCFIEGEVGENAQCFGNAIVQSTGRILGSAKIFGIANISDTVSSGEIFE